MSTAKAFVYAVGITAFSVVFLTINKGMPRMEHAISAGLAMFFMAFIVMKLFGGNAK